MKGCEAPSTITVLKYGGLIFQRCPANFQSTLVLSWMMAHAAFRNQGVLPYPGSLMEQPNKIMEIFGIMDTVKAERDQENAQRQRLEQRGR